MTQIKVKINCCVCRKEPAFFAKKNGCALYRCANCGLIFIWPRLPVYREIYTRDYFFGAKNELGYADYEGDAEIISRTFGHYLRKVEKFLPEKGKIFDVGAATGHFIQLAKKHGWLASGIEIADHAAALGREKGLEIAIGNFEEDAGSADLFDAVTFWDVLEHFTAPELAVRQAQKILKPGGLLAINTPDTGSFLAKVMGRRWHLLVPPNHLHYFNRKNLNILLSQNNFEIVHMSRVGKIFSLRSIFKVLANWQKLTLWRKISNYLLTSPLGALEMPLNTRDNLFLIARKKYE